MRDQYTESIFADGLDEAIIGVDINSERIIYSVSKVLKILMDRDGMSYDDALEFFEYNIANAHVGDKMPIWSAVVLTF